MRSHFLERQLRRIELLLFILVCLLNSNNVCCRSAKNISLKNEEKRTDIGLGIDDIRSDKRLHCLNEKTFFVLANSGAGSRVLRTDFLSNGDRDSYANPPNYEKMAKNIMRIDAVKVRPQRRSCYLAGMKRNSTGDPKGGRPRPGRQLSRQHCQCDLPQIHHS